MVVLREGNVMKYRFGSLLLSTVSLLAWSPTHATVLTGHAAVIAAPFEAHAGGRVYLSGGGFSAGSRLTLVLGCPDYRHPVARFGAVTTDNRGQFVARVVTVPRDLKKERSCAVYAGQGRPRSVPAPLLLVPHNRALKHCAVTMCLHVRASLIRLHSGTEGNIVVNGWPGAQARVTVLGPNGSHLRRSVRLGWRGTGAVRLRVSLGLKKGVAKQVQVTARLGAVAGSTTTGFSVLPSGRY